MLAVRHDDDDNDECRFNFFANLKIFIFLIRLKQHSLLVF